METPSARPQVIGRYAIYGKIASGGMASVHFGRLQGAAGFSRTVAIKRLHPHLAEDPDFLATMIDEARLAARIHHPNVVPTLDVVSTEGELLVVMEYVRGESLARVARAENARGRRVPLPIVGAITVGALQGLHAAHEATTERGKPLGIVHRDVSPQNILVGVDGVARVIDFGIAKAAGRLQTTDEGVIKGKIAYMAPEQVAGREVTRRADVYSMAVVLWELLTGRRLFQAEQNAALMSRVMEGAREPPSLYAPNLPPGLDELVMKGLALDPGDRLGTAREMADQVANLLPPSLSSHVGAWVEEAVGDALAQRGAILADIESHSGVASSRPEPLIPSSPAGDDVPTTVASQLSNATLSVETTGLGSAVIRRSPLAKAAVAAASAALVVGTYLLWPRGGRPPDAAAPPSPAASSPAAVAPPIPAVPPPTGYVAETPSTPPTASSSASPHSSVASSAVPATPRPAARSAPRPPSSTPQTRKPAVDAVDPLAP